MGQFIVRIAGFASLIILPVGFTTADEKKPKPDAAQLVHGEMLQACAKACSSCQRECSMCSTFCAHYLLEGKKDHLLTLTTCQDCADVCAAASLIVSRGGPYATTICETCAEVCADCAKQCEKFPDDKHMKRCAEECRKCEKTCREMVKSITMVSR